MSSVATSPSMACCSIPIKNEVLDFVGGRKDLEAGIIRTIGRSELRFAEDKLRMLRAVRFAARFGYTIEPETFAAIQKLAAGIGQVSRERVRDELTKMLTEGRARQAFLLLDETGLLQRSPAGNFCDEGGAATARNFIPKATFLYTPYCCSRNLPQPCPATLAWGALLHDVGKPPTFRVAPDRIRFDNHVDVGVKMAEEICRRLRFSNDDTEQILALVANHMRFSHVPQMKESTFKRFVRMPQFEQHLELHRLDCQASHGDLTSYNFTRQRIAAIPPETIRPASLISGDDLIAAGLRARAAIQGNSLTGGRCPTRRAPAVERQRTGVCEARISSARQAIPERTDRVGADCQGPLRLAFCPQTVEVKRNIFFLCLSHLPCVNCYAENIDARSVFRSRRKLGEW